MEYLLSNQIRPTWSELTVVCLIKNNNKINLVSSFWNISCKMPGSAHDASVLRNSDLFQKAHLLPKVRPKRGQCNPSGAMNTCSST